MLSNLYEINTATWFYRLSQSHSEKITLGNIPESEIDKLVELGMDSVWLMGIWQRSDDARMSDLANLDVMNEVHQTLVDYTDDDLIGSAYAIKSYTVDKRFGDSDQLANFRERLAKREIKLILDFVPNHSAFDSSWLINHPEYYITIDPAQSAYDSSYFREYDGRVVAYGKDPSLNAWRDVAQLNAFSTSYREASQQTLATIAKMCDGVRCDMSMLMLNSVFAETWGSLAGALPETEYWHEIISHTKSITKDFVFIAEVYWGKERELLSLGFDYCYDKVFYDLLTGQDSARLLEDHLNSTRDISQHLVYFLENHDEQRIANILNGQAYYDTVAKLHSQPGLKLWHDGQLEGYRTKIPVRLNRAPIEEIDLEIKEFYRDLLSNSR